MSAVVQAGCAMYVGWSIPWLVCDRRRARAPRPVNAARWARLWVVDR